MQRREARRDRRDAARARPSPCRAPGARSSAGLAGTGAARAPPARRGSRSARGACRAPPRCRRGRRAAGRHRAPCSRGSVPSASVPVNDERRLRRDGGDRRRRDPAGRQHLGDRDVADRAHADRQDRAHGRGDRGDRTRRDAAPAARRRASNSASTRMQDEPQIRQQPRLPRRRVAPAFVTPSTVAPPGGGGGGAAESVPSFDAADDGAQGVLSRATGGSRWRASRPRGRRCLRSAGDQRGARQAACVHQRAQRQSGCPCTFANVGAASAVARASGSVTSVFAYAAAAALVASCARRIVVVDAQHVADLLPREPHVALLVVADHARAEAGGGAIARIEIQRRRPSPVPAALTRSTARASRRRSAARPADRRRRPARRRRQRAHRPAR